MKRDSFFVGLHIGLLGALVVVVCAVVACTADDRVKAARAALDAVETADRTCTDLHEALHHDAGGDGP